MHDVSLSIYGNVRGLLRTVRGRNVCVDGPGDALNGRVFATSEWIIRVFGNRIIHAMKQIKKQPAVS